MERVIALSKRMMVSLFTRGAWAVFAKSCRRSFPFIRMNSSKQALFTPDYGVRDDHLFMPTEYSAKHSFSKETISLFVVGLLAFVSMLFSISLLMEQPVPVILSAIVALFYLIFIVFKLHVVFVALQTPFVKIADARVSGLTDAELPKYTIMLPMKYEAEVMDQIIDSITALDYPEDKLDVIALVEGYDTETREALKRAPKHWKTFVLPYSMPQAKPKSMNCAFLEAEGEYLVIYDAEIIPDPDQMKKAVLAFRDHPEIAMFQPRLDHYNTNQNLLTRLFTMEFTFHYDMFLPGLSKFQLPVPLSGHSTHFRMDALRRAGGWDPYNMAEDCEIGIRLFRMGYRSHIFDSLSQEEAASGLKSWIHQRTRWMKGFIQTSLVHLRYPLLTYKQMGGLQNFVAFLLTVPGTVLLNILNLFSWMFLIIWVVFQPAFIQDLYPFFVLYVANLAAIVGGFLFVYLNVVALYRREKFHLIKWFFLMPIYWLLLAYATVRAAKQMVTNPHVWEKTTHGTHLNKE